MKNIWFSSQILLFYFVQPAHNVLENSHWCFICLSSLNVVCQQKKRVNDKV